MAQKKDKIIELVIGKDMKKCELKLATKGKFTVAPTVAHLLKKGATVTYFTQSDA